MCVNPFGFPCNQKKRGFYLWVRMSIPEKGLLQKPGGCGCQNRFGIPFLGFRCTTGVGEFTTHFRLCFSGWIGMFTGNTIWLLTHGQVRPVLPGPLPADLSHVFLPGRLRCAGERCQRTVIEICRSRRRGGSLDCYWATDL